MKIDNTINDLTDIIHDIRDSESWQKFKDDMLETIWKDIWYLEEKVKLIRNIVEPSANANDYDGTFLNLGISITGLRYKVQNKLDNNKGRTKKMETKLMGEEEKLTLKKRKMSDQLRNAFDFRSTFIHTINSDPTSVQRQKLEQITDSFVNDFVREEAKAALAFLDVVVSARKKAYSTQQHDLDFQHLVPNTKIALGYADNVVCLARELKI